MPEKSTKAFSPARWTWRMVGMSASLYQPEIPDLFYQNNIKGWGPQLCEKRSDVTMDTIHNFLTSMYTNRADFVSTVSRDFVRSIKQPLLIAPDDVPAHPYKVAMEVASLARTPR